MVRNGLYLLLLHSWSNDGTERSLWPQTEPLPRAVPAVSAVTRHGGAGPPGAGRPKSGAPFTPPHFSQRQRHPNLSRRVPNLLPHRPGSALCPKRPELSQHAIRSWARRPRRAHAAVGPLAARGFGAGLAAVPPAATWGRSARGSARGARLQSGGAASAAEGTSGAARLHRGRP